MPPRKARKRTHANLSIPSASPSTSPSQSPSPSLSASPVVDAPSFSVAVRDSNDVVAHHDSPDRLERRRAYAREAAARVESRGGPDTVYTTADVSLRLTQEFIEWAILEVAIEAHHDRYLRSSDCPAVLHPIKDLNDKKDALKAGPLSENALSQKCVSAARVVAHHHGSLPSPESSPSGVLLSDKNVNVECTNCSSSTAASRYAQHLEKCLGRGGRSSSRAASARLKASAEKAEKEAAAEYEEHMPRKRRAAVDVSGSNADGVHASPKDEDMMYNDPASLSPSPPGGGKGRTSRS